MLTIQKIRANPTIDFAAEELKKYLRMMMPECGDIKIFYNPEAKDGFRLGLLEDFSLPFEGEDTFLDDVIHVDTTEEGGILCGSNPRSVLFAVYRFLRLNGCRWLYPGIDGEFVPVRDITPQTYHKMASYRIRGHCNEGAESQQCMMETIDFYAKQELNCFMIEFFNPWSYYDRYYSHIWNTANRTPEPITEEQALQWKRQCEVELAKRGIQFHDIGHGWCTKPFGLPDTEHWNKAVAKGAILTDEVRKHLALTEGKRDIFHNHAKYTNLCMSNPETRKIVVDYVVNYAKTHSNVDLLCISMADNNHNHCECEECQKARPSDFFVMMLNEMDEALTKEGLDTRLAFSLYVDSYFAPIREKIHNEKRFLMKYCPIGRDYGTSIKMDSVIPEPKPYIRNAWDYPRTTEESVSYLKAWQKVCSCTSYVYEYHFWRHQYCDPGTMTISRRIYEDLQSLAVMGLQGSVEDGSQRAFFPNGFSLYLYAETLMDHNSSYEEIRKDYFEHSYGKDYPLVIQYLETMSALFNFNLLEKLTKKDFDLSQEEGLPEQIEKLKKVNEYTNRLREIIQKHLVMPTRPQTVSWRLLLYHTDFCDGLSDCLIEMLMDHRATARKKYLEFCNAMGKNEVWIERYFDHMLAFNSMNRFFTEKAIQNNVKNGIIF